MVWRKSILKNGDRSVEPWTLEQSSLELIEPRYSQLTAVPLAWSASTNGPVTGDLVLAPLRVSFRDGPKKSKEAMQAYRAKWAGKLRGKIVLLSDPKVPAPQNDPQFRRYTAAELADMAIAPTPATKLVRQEARRTGMAGGSRPKWGSSSAACLTH